jgi:Glycosyl hydrolases family 16
VVNRWGPVVAGDEFNYTGAPDNQKWHVYDSAGHAGNGVRSPAAWNVDGSVARVTGDSSGTTGGMSASFERQKYGRWEARMRTSARSSQYHPVLLLWPESKDWPCDGEIDYAEGTGDTTRMNFFVHHGCDNQQISSRKVIDTTQWHDYAVEWQPDGITGYIDGVEWFRTTNAGYLPPGAMYQTIQLDWFPDGTTPKPSWMEVDWVRVYDPASAASTSSSTPVTAPTPTLTPDSSPTSSPTPVTAPTPTLTPDPSPTQTTGDIVIGAVGDTNPSGNTSTTSASGLNAASIKAANLDAWLHLGDHQYTYGDCNSLVNQFDKAGWGAVWAKALNVSGPTHDWSSGTDVSSVTQHQAGTCSGQTSGRSLDNILTGRNLGPDSNYVVDLGAWRVISMSSGLWRYDTSKANAATGWLDTALATAKAAGDHVIVVWHEPYWTSTSEEHGPTPAVKPWIDLLDKYDVPLLLNGHQHGYARFYPQLANSTKDDAAGTQEFIVGTGGIGSYSWTSTASNVATQQADTYGWLKLTLHADGHYDWQFIRTSGGGYTDRGSR